MKPARFVAALVVVHLAMAGLGVCFFDLFDKKKSPPQAAKHELEHHDQANHQKGPKNMKQARESLSSVTEGGLYAPKPSRQRLTTIDLGHSRPLEDELLASDEEEDEDDYFEMDETDNKVDSYFSYESGSERDQMMRQQAQAAVQANLQLEKQLRAPVPRLNRQQVMVPSVEQTFASPPPDDKTEATPNQQQEQEEQQQQQQQQKKPQVMSGGAFRVPPRSNAAGLKARINYDQFQRKPNGHQSMATTATTATAAAAKKLMSTSYLKGKMKNAYKATKKTVAPVVKSLGELPKMIGKAPDFLQAWAKLDNKGKLLALMFESDKDVLAIKTDFSDFSFMWQPVMEEALNYIGAHDLHKLKWNDNDELDYRKDALKSACMAYEFMAYMIIWRENMIMAQSAYRNYLESVKQDLQEQRIAGTLDESFFESLNTVLHYLLLRAWESVRLEAAETLEKLQHLTNEADMGAREYERTYFRNLIILQEYYKPTMENFAKENQRAAVVVATTKQAGANLDQAESYFNELLEYYVDYREQVRLGAIEVDVKLPEALLEFMEDVGPELKYNPRAYPKNLLVGLKDARQRVLEETVVAGNYEDET